MKHRGLILISAVFLMLTVSGNVWAETGNKTAKEVDQSSLYMRIPSAEHKKMFPHGHKKIEGKQCIFDKETDSFFCQYYKQYDGYINR